ncbi:alpha/beta hydrolase [Pontiella agarivorans]|uniref:Alpha/beta hydrolase n=1 Tax=Pontiella agarivorans TaxID=3038953 RepID=A0ABU5MWU7_9BACT|nr:alpha/beta hydrolase [Pontiella agarivorans]MDZ8118531.1 alpha/beta hydrolase [Pontiella agarivorans]
MKKCSLLLVVCCMSAVLVSRATEINDLSYDQYLSEYEYPFEVNAFAFESQGKSLNMTYMVLEAGETRPWVTLLHGKNFNGAYWEETAKFLQEKGFNVLMPDQIGFGKSSKPTEYQYSFAALAANTKALMESLHIQQSMVVGHSMGGMLASRFALQYPEQTEKLILVNPIGLENYLEFVQYKDVNFFYENELKKTAEGVRSYQQKNYYDGDWNARYEALTYPLIGWAQGPDREIMARVNALTYDLIFTQPVVTEFADLQVPTVLILGTRDRTGPGRGWKRPGVTHELGRYDLLGERMKKRIPEMTLYELSDLGHLPQIEDFERFRTVFDQAIFN